ASVARVRALERRRDHRRLLGAHVDRRAEHDDVRALDAEAELEVREALVAARQIDDLHRRLLAATLDAHAVRSARQLEAERRDAAPFTVDPDRRTLQLF